MNALAKPMPAEIRDWLIVTSAPPVFLATREAKRIAAAYGMTLDEVRSRSRKTGRVAARKAIAAAMRGIGLSYPQIGRMLCRHHTTILIGASAGDRAALAVHQVAMGEDAP